MKKLQLLSLALAMFALSSCSNNDEPENLADSAVGNYSGYTVASCAYFSNMAADNQSVTISSSEINTANISFVSDTWGSFTIGNATLSGSGDNVVISGSGKCSMAHAGSQPKEYDCTVEGSVAGKILALTFSCPTVMGGLSIEFRQGDVPADVVVPGTYKGYTEAKSTYFAGMMTADQQIVIAKNADGSFKVTYTSDTWGEFVVDNVAAEYASGKFTLSGTGTTSMGMNGNVKDYECEFAGEVDVEKNDPSFTFTVPAVMGGLSVTFHSGDMPEEESN